MEVRRAKANEGMMKSNAVPTESSKQECNDRSLIQIAAIALILIVGFYSSSDIATAVAPGWSDAVWLGINNNTTNDFARSLIQDSGGKYWLTLASNRDDPNYEIYISNSTDGLQWSATVRVTNNSSLDGEASLIQDQGAKFWIALRSNRANTTAPMGKGNEIWIMNSTNGVDWNDTAPIRVTNNTASDLYPSIIQDKSGKYWIAWRTDAVNLDGDVWITNSTDGVNWNTSIAVTNNSNANYTPSLIQDSSGKFWMADVCRDGPTEQVCIFNSTNGVDWLGPTRITEIGNNCFNPSLVQDLSGGYILACSGYGVPYDIYFSASDNGVVWLNAIQITTNASEDGGPRLLVDSNGTLWLAWMSERSGNRDIWITHSTVTLTSPNASEIISASHNVSWVSISGDYTNDSFTLYYSDDGGDNWTPIQSGIPADDVYTNNSTQWDISSLADGDKYRIKIVRTHSWSGHNETDISGNFTIDKPDPSIIGWGNNKTNNQTLSITINESEAVTFNVTANQSVNYSWYKDGVDQNWNYDNNTTSWAVNGTYEINASVTNANGTSANKSWTITVNDITAPASITNLLNSTYASTYINWTWTNPADSDFNHTTVYINGAWEANVSTPYYNDTGLSGNTTYNIGTHTVDTNGNINTTWVNTSAQTAPVPPSIISWYNNKTGSSLNLTINVSESVYFNATANQSITTWNWYKDGVAQGVDCDNITLSWNSAHGTRTVTVNATNANGTSNTVTWNIYFAVLSPSGWSDDVRLTDNAGSPWHPAIALNGSNLHVVWMDHRDENTEIYYKNSTDGGATWSDDVRLTNNTSKSYEPAIALNGSKLHVVWHDLRDGNWEIYYKNSTDGGATWSDDVRLTNNTSSSFEPTIAVNGSNLHVVWSDKRHEKYEIYYKNSTNNGATWGDDVRLTNNTSNSRYPVIAVNGSNLHVVWHDYRYGNSEVYYKNSTDGGATWSDDVRLTNATSNSGSPAIALNGSNLHVVWFDGRDGNYEIYYKNSTDGGQTCGGDVRLTNNESGPSGSRYPVIALNGSNLHVVWKDDRDDSEVYYKNSTDGGATWSDDVRLTNAASVSGYPAIALNGSNLHVIWIDYRDVDREIYYKRYPDFTPAPTPTATPMPSGGGDGGYSPTPTPVPTVTVTVEISKEVGVIEAGKSEVVTFEEPESDISEITINVKNNVSGVEITIQKLSDAPPEIKTTPPPTITGAAVETYSYLNISTTNITDDDIANVSINFTVNKTWILEEEIDEDSVTLHRYNNTTANWTALNTSKTGEDNTSVYYEAETPGFSIFAITGDRETVVEPTPSATPAPTLTPVLAPTATPAVVVTPTLPIPEPTVPEPRQLVPEYTEIIILGAVTALIALYFFYMWRKPSVRELKEKAKKIIESQTGKSGEGKKQEK